MEKLIERIAKAPLGAKLGAVFGTLAVVTLLNYLVFSIPFGPSISEMEEKIARANRDQVNLDKDFVEKTAIANNLNQFRREKELLEQRLSEALAELPEEKNIDELLRLFQDRAIKAGLKIGSIEPKAPVPEKFYAKIPIPMSVSGNYHEIATFFDSLGRMRRIVNVSEVVLDGPKDVNGKIILNGKFIVTAFMFVDSAKASKGAGPANAPGGAR